MRRSIFNLAITVLMLSLLLCSHLVAEGESLSEPSRDDGRVKIISEAAWASFIGYVPNEKFGTYVSSGSGDLNNDGYDDLVISDPNIYNNDTSSGRVFVYFGGPQILERQTNRSDPDISFLGESIASDTGLSTSFVGDINGDGMDDLMIGAPSHRQDGVRGKVYIFFGRSGEWEDRISLIDSDASLIAEGNNHGLGRRIVKIGDVNRDGLDDVMIAAPYFSTTEATYCGKVYIVHGKTGGWRKNVSVAGSPVSFIGTDPAQKLGFYSFYCGDVNDDGIGDVAFGSPEKISNAGMIYLVFGEGNAWRSNVSITEADTRIFGEPTCFLLGTCLSGGGDVNGDSIDDMVIGVPKDLEYGTDTGKAYLLLGREGGWAEEFYLNNSDTIFHTEAWDNELGTSVSVSSDLNCDGIDDIAISAPKRGEDGLFKGNVFIIHGRTEKIPQNINISNSDLILRGEADHDNTGSILFPLGDVSGGGTSGLGVVSTFNDEGSYNAGKVYLITSGINEEPTEIHSLDLFSDPDLEAPASILDRGETLYVRLTGKDGNISKKNLAFINIRLNSSLPGGIRLSLRETDIDTGIYTGNFKVPADSVFGEILTATSINDPSKFGEVLIDTPIMISDIPKTLTVAQGEEMEIQFENLGYCEEPSWTVNKNAGWLDFDEEMLALRGTPENKDVGPWSAEVLADDGSGHSDRKYFTISVKNRAPEILTEDVTTAHQGSEYSVDYMSSEDGDGEISWSYATNATFLYLDEGTGVLSGTPTNDDIGWFWVNIWVDDGNDGKDSHHFNLTVIDVNDRPVIMTEDITNVVQGEPYRRNYRAVDIDPVESFTWSLVTEASWLHLDPDTGTLTGTPGPFDVGCFEVNVTVTDSRGLSDSHVFDLTVENVNDAPILGDLPERITIKHGEQLNLTVNAVDPDPEDQVEFLISSEPASDIRIDRSSGKVNFMASTVWFASQPFDLKVKVEATDGNLKSKGTFIIEVEPSLPPRSELKSPADGARVSPRGFMLKWEAADPDSGELEFDIYLHQNEVFVSTQKSEALLIEDQTRTIIQVNDLELGREYFWTVIPGDGCSHGECNTGVWSFKLNSPPTVEQLDLQEISAGQRYRQIIKASDGDREDYGKLRYSLVEAPDGMTIDPESGLIVWTPAPEQALMFRVVVNVSDGIDQTRMIFTLDVMKEGKGGSKSLLLIGGISATFIIIGASAVLFMISRRKGGITKGEEIVEEQVIGAVEKEEEKVAQCIVSLTPAEAHSHLGKGSREVSYEDLYGVKAPGIDDEIGPDASELRDFIGKQIRDLEEMGREE